MLCQHSPQHIAGEAWEWEINSALFFHCSDILIDKPLKTFIGTPYDNTSTMTFLHMQVYLSAADDTGLLPASR